MLAAVRPDFRAFASLPVQHATSGVWRRHQLFLLTPDTLVLAFAAAGGGGGRTIGLGGTNEPFLEVPCNGTFTLYDSVIPPAAKSIRKGISGHLPAL